MCKRHSQFIKEVSSASQLNLHVITMTLLTQSIYPTFDTLLRFTPLLAHCFNLISAFPSSLPVMSDQDLKKLASDLLNSYSSYLNSPNLANLEHLNQYNSHLPLSWFTPQLLNVLQTHFNAGDPKVQPPIFGLWSTWIRRLVLSDGDLASAQQYLPFVITQFEQVLTTGTNVDSIKYALIATSCLTGVNIGETDDVQRGKQLAHAIPHLLTLPQDKDLHDTLDASLSYFIANATSPDAISEVLSSYVQSLGVQVRRIFLMVENAADLRWRDKGSGKSLAVLWGALQTIHKNSSNKTASTSAIAGLVYVNALLTL